MGAKPILAFTLLFAYGCSSLPRPVDDARAERAAAEARRVPKDPYDAEVFAQLKKAGHDFTKPTTVDFYLYFPEEAAARGVIHVLAPEGYRGDLKNVDGRFQAHLAKDMVLTSEAIDMERFKMREFTVNSGGEYDGWGAQVVR
jgi:hypothetical protein